MKISAPAQKLLLALLPDQALSGFIFARKNREGGAEQARAFFGGLAADAFELGSAPKALVDLFRKP